MEDSTGGQSVDAVVIGEYLPRLSFDVVDSEYELSY